MLACDAKFDGDSNKSMSTRSSLPGQIAGGSGAPIKERCFRAASHTSTIALCYAAKLYHEDFREHAYYVTRWNTRFTLDDVPKWAICQSDVIWCQLYCVALLGIWALLSPNHLWKPRRSARLQLAVLWALISFKCIKSGCRSQGGYGLFRLLIKRCYVALNAILKVFDFCRQKKRLLFQFHSYLHQKSTDIKGALESMRKVSRIEMLLTSSSLESRCLRY